MAPGEPPSETRAPPLQDGAGGVVPAILVVDDNESNLEAIEVALGESRRLVKVRSGREALRCLLQQEFALILLDVHMPGMDGFETARVIRERPRSRHTPIIFVTAYGQDETEMLRGYALGAVDFLFKPIVPEVLRSKVGVIVALQERTEQARRQGERLRELERLELERNLAAERQRWESEALRDENQRKDQFLAVLAHELRNPLTPIVIGLELIRRYQIEHDGLEQVRVAMMRQVQLLVRLVDDLLDATRISQGKVVLRPERLDLESVVSQAVETVRPLIEEREHDLGVEASPEPVLLVGDRVRLTQVAANLLNNAARHTDPGGRIHVSWARDGDQAVLRVADNGPGIAPEMRERIFQMFVQDKRSGKGLGLGLSLVEQLVSLHGGKVQAYSEGPGKGSQFVVRLPLGDPAAAPAADDGPPAAEPEPERAGGLRVVLVEDERDIRVGMSELLASLGHQVEVAEDGVRGVELILESSPDVALVDIAMPGLDGYAVARRVRQELGPRAPRLVAVTGFGRDEDRERSRRAGFDDHLVKPADPATLGRVLRR